MEDQNLQDQVFELNRKLDLVLEEIEHQKRSRREMDDLKDDLMRVGKDLYSTAVDELEEVHDHLNTGDLLHLGKKLLRNVNTISNGVEQLESIKDFLEDFAPISRQSVIDFMQTLDEFDRKGYFEFMKQFRAMTDNIVTSFSVEDVKNLGDNVVTILNTIKSLTQPDMLQAINNAVSVYKNLDIQVSEKVSTFSLIKELNSPEVKKGLAFGIEFLKNLAKQQNENLTEIKNIQTN